MIQGGPNSGKNQEIAYTEFVAQLNQGNIQEVTIEGNVAQGKFKNGSMFHLIVPATN